MSPMNLYEPWCFFLLLVVIATDLPHLILWHFWVISGSSESYESILSDRKTPSNSETRCIPEWVSRGQHQSFWFHHLDAHEPWVLHQSLPCRIPLVDWEGFRMTWRIFQPARTRRTAGPSLKSRQRQPPLCCAQVIGHGTVSIKLWTNQPFEV